jgi:hypothetical protein
MSGGGANSVSRFTLDEKEKCHSVPTVFCITLK